MKKLLVLPIMFILLLSNVSAEDCANRVSYPTPLVQWAMKMTDDTSFGTQSGPTGQYESFTESSLGLETPSTWDYDSSCDSSEENPVGAYYLTSASAIAIASDQIHKASHRAIVARITTGMGISIIDTNYYGKPAPFVTFKILPTSGSAIPNAAKKDKDGNYVLVGRTNANDVFIISITVGDDKSITVNWAKKYNYAAGSETLDTGDFQVVGDYIVTLIDSETSDDISVLVVDSDTGTVQDGMAWSYTDPAVGGFEGNIGVAGDNSYRLNIKFGAPVLGVSLPQFISITIGAGGTISEDYSLAGTPSMINTEVMSKGEAAMPENGDNVALLNGYDPSGENQAYGTYAIDKNGLAAYGGYTTLSKGCSVAAPVGGNYFGVASKNHQDQYQFGVLDTTSGEFLWSDMLYSRIDINDVNYAEGFVYLAGYNDFLQQPFASMYRVSDGSVFDKANIVWNPASGNPKVGTEITGFYVDNVYYYMIVSEGSFGYQVFGLGGPTSAPEFSLTTMLLAVLLAGGLFLFVVRRRR